MLHKMLKFPYCGLAEIGKNAYVSRSYFQQSLQRLHLPLLPHPRRCLERERCYNPCGPFDNASTSDGMYYLHYAVCNFVLQLPDIKKTNLMDHLWTNYRRRPSSIQPTNTKKIANGSTNTEHISSPVCRNSSKNSGISQTD